jgi:hypothetical protein
MVDFNAQTRDKWIRDHNAPRGEGNRHSKGDKLLDMCNRNDWVIGKKWVEKRKSHKITCYSWDCNVETINDYFISIQILSDILNDVKVILGITSEGDNRI